MSASREPPRLSCFDCPTRRLAEWRVLPDDAQALVDRRKQTHAYAPGSPVFQAGEPTRALFCIHEGTVALRRSDEQGNSVLVKLAHRHQTLGTYEFFDNREYVASAECLGAAVICSIEAAAVRELVLRHPALGLAFMEHLAQDLEHAHERFLQIAALPVRRRLAHLLLSLLPHFAERDATGATVVHLPMTQHTIAELLGARRETVVRAFQAMQADGVLHYDEGRVTLPDPARLRAEAEAGE